MGDFVPQFIVNTVEWVLGIFYSLPEWLQYLTITTWKILFVMIGVILCVAFSTYFERKVIGTPDRQSLCFDCLHQRTNPLAVLGVVADEDVGHLFD